MTKETKKTKDFPGETLNGMWPFSNVLAVNLYNYNKRLNCSSLRKFLLSDYFFLYSDCSSSEGDKFYKDFSDEPKLLYDGLDEKLYFKSSKNNIYYIPSDTIMCAAIKYSLNRILKKDEFTFRNLCFFNRKRLLSYRNA